MRALTKDVSNKAPSSRSTKMNNGVSTQSTRWHALHQTLGNQGVQRLLRAGVVQAKLRVGRPNDSYEQEADHAAERVKRMETPGWDGNRSAASVAPIIQRRVSEGADGLTEAPPLVHEVLRSPGQPLDPSTRDFMEPRLGADFREVRVHTDAEAAASARLMGAHAYTVGRDVVFAAGKFSPATAEGRALLAHELTHVRQDPRSPSVLRRAEATGGTVDSGLEAPIDADVQRIIAILNEWHYSDADEQRVIDILTKWALAGTGTERFTPLDRVFSKLIQRTTTIGVMGQTTSYYSLIFNHFDRVQEVRNLRDRYTRTFQSETGMQEISILQQDWMRTAGEAWSPIKEGLYEAMISGMRGAQAAGLSRLRAMIAEWPPVAQLAGAVVIDQIEMITDTLISLVLALVGLVVGFVSGIAKLVWGLLQFLWGILDIIMLSVLGNFSDARREQLDQRITAIREGVANLGPALRILKDRWMDEFSKASPDRQTVMIGELTGEVEAILASFLAGGKVAGALPKLEAAPAQALAVVGGGTLVRGGAIAGNLAAVGPPLIMGTLVGTTATAVSQEAKGGGKEPLPSERKFQPGEWERMSPDEQKAFIDQWMKEHNIERAPAGPAPRPAPIEVPSEAEKLTKLKSELGQAREVEAIRETGTTGAGLARPPRHHVFPQEYQSFFEQRGLQDIDEFTVDLEEATHQAIHGGGDWRRGRAWPGEWNTNIMRELIEAETRQGGALLTREQILEIGRNLMRRYGIDQPFVPYNAPAP